MTQQSFNHHRRDVATTVGAVIDDKGLLVGLCEEIACELTQSLGTHVRDIDVAHTATRLLVHIVDIVLNPLVVVERILVLDGLDNHLAAVSQGQLGHHTSLVAQQRVDVVHASSRYAVNGSDDVTFLDVHARLEQR